MNDDIDYEFDWIIRTCINGLNLFLTMLHFVVYDNLTNMQSNFPGKYFLIEY